jgi:hypothetical protein
MSNSEEERQKLIDELNDPDCDHIGPYKKSGENEIEIETLLAKNGLHIDDDGDLRRRGRIWMV